ncbi:MAG: hypothetical protein OER90_13090 [Gemmatimonadota bacterium]|nr:hypothetical protein [Gemmatimonadota bacterium]
MPVTAKLSQKFYERLGEDLAQELVDWFNAVDATYRADLREFNELNFQRFDAKVEQRLAELRTHLERRLVESDARWEQRFTSLDKEVGRRLSIFGKDFEQQLTVLSKDVDRRLAELAGSVARLETTFERRLGAVTNSLIRWMFGFWALTLGALAGILYYLR